MSDYKIEIEEIEEEIREVIDKAIQRITKLPRKSKFYGDFDESTAIEGIFWTNGISTKIDGEFVEGVFRFQSDVQKEKRMIVLDSYGVKPRVIGDRMYVYRIYLTVVE